ncbi:CheR family methyltransferase [uncultured Roseobacter sp.]|uniref:CheR family methyltransferase n=1 Tax=uncultured Roseobacter sp. TaxID=114847 RepID=UPI002630A6CE|nr:CheR family methyltransferase [uncultured Roseobacter sp.]
MTKSTETDTTIDSASFESIARLTYNESGLQLATEKKSMIQSRLRHRLRALDLEDFKQYTALVCSDSGRDERKHMISALTTNVSHFFREAHHFDILTNNLENNLIPRLKSGGAVRIWSAGCSNGQEAFSIAMTLLELLPDAEKYNVRILATDIDSKVVRHAQAARYSDRLTSGIPDRFLNKFFVKDVIDEEKIYTATNCLTNLVSFKELNLLGNWPMKQKMDVIFCRNVVIYFDLETQNALWPRFHQSLNSDGHLFLGHSERIADPQLAGFRTDGPTTYRPL